MDIRNIFRRRATPHAAPTPRHLPYTRLTLADWCASPERVAYVGELFKAPLFRDLVGMLANVRPAQPRTGCDATTAAMLLGQRLGHDQILATLQAAATLPTAPPTDVPIDYNAANVMALWEGAHDENT